MRATPLLRFAAPVMCATVLAGGSYVHHDGPRPEGTAAEPQAFAGHPFRATAACTQDEMVSVRIEPVAEDGVDLMHASFTIRAAEPGSRWTFGLEVTGGGSGEAADGEFTVRQDGTARIAQTARLAHVRQAFRLLTLRDTETPADVDASSCELRARVKY